FAAERVYTRATYERALLEFAPDLILSDFSMPTDLDGFTALGIAREQAIGVPFIFVSGTIGEERAVAAMKAGATDYVLKDRLERLGPVVKRALQEARDRKSMLRAQEALLTSEATFRSFMQHLPGRASIRDRDGRYTYVNGLWQASFGLRAEDVVGKPYYEVLDPARAAQLKPMHDQVVATNEPVKIITRRGEGDDAEWWLSHHFPIPGHAGEPGLIGTIAVDVSEQKQQGDRLAYLAWHDPLTGLGNRVLLQARVSDALAAAKQAGTGIAVVAWDVKRFRTINASVGRESGDALLRALPRRLAELWPQVSDMARLSSDNFAGVVRDGADALGVASLLEQSAQALSEPYLVDGKEIVLDVTVGIALYPNNGDTAEALLANAEAALKEAKTRGESYLFYEVDMNARVAERLSLEGRLRRALEREQFVLHYEPKVDLNNGRVAGMEALIRWNDPESGELVHPHRFIPVLEETGLILEVGRWALSQALSDWKSRSTSARAAPRIAVNVSAMQLRRPDFVDMVEKVLLDCEGGRHGLDVEITESLLMEDITANVAKLHALKAMGINIAIDDFGTGYSSLSYLARLPVDALKIDAAFIKTMVDERQSMTIVSTIISLAHTLRLVVVAEGVETSAQANLLRDLHCDLGQGFFFSRGEPTGDELDNDQPSSPV
ncbi:MAG TPA: EAL domain-containing protein, partial [Burkholderiales bacterium]|nr:EAL domain-containing protein [Burkholderiales bacterium]